MAHLRVRSVLGILARVLVLVAAASLVGWAAVSKPPAPKMTQKDHYLLATRSAYGVFSTYPKQRHLVLAAVNKTYLALGLDYVRQATTQGTVVGGEYDSKTRTVCVLSEFVRAEAGLPDAFRPQFVHLLRHEYGHALVEDLLKIKYGGPARNGQKYPAFDEAEATRDSSKELSLAAPVLRPVVNDWLKAPRGLYGLEHNTETFNEYFAESYARFMEGKAIPDATRRFLQSQSQVGRSAN